MIGLQELGIIGGIALLILLFGKKTVLKGIKELFSLKRDVNEVIKEEKEFNTTKK